MDDVIFKRYKIRSYEMGLYFRDGEFRGLLEQGRTGSSTRCARSEVEVVSRRATWLVAREARPDREVGALKDRAVVLDLKDYERALVWIEGRFSHVLAGGLYAYWTGLSRSRSRWSTRGTSASSTTSRSSSARRWPSGAGCCAR